MCEAFVFLDENGALLFALSNLSGALLFDLTVGLLAFGGIFIKLISLLFSWMVGCLYGNILAVEFLFWGFGLFDDGTDEVRDFLWFGDLEVEILSGRRVWMSLAALNVGRDVTVEIGSGEIIFVIGFWVDVRVSDRNLSEVGGGGLWLGG